MASQYIALEILFHFPVYPAVFLCEPCFSIEIQVFQALTFTIALQIIVDETVNQKLGRYREKERPLIIDYCGLLFLQNNIGRKEINIGNRGAFQSFFQIHISKYLDKFRCFLETFFLMDLFYFLDIGKQ